MKRTIKALLLLAFGGCISAKTPFLDMGELVNPDGTERLRLRFVEVQLPRPTRGFDFDSLIWECTSNGTWVVRKQISNQDFQLGEDKRRWIIKLHSFTPETSLAVFQVGEAGLTDSNGVHYVTYSWREWDLTNNKEVRTIQVCRDPSEPFPAGEPNRDQR